MRRWLAVCGALTALVYFVLRESDAHGLRHRGLPCPAECEPCPEVYAAAPAAAPPAAEMARPAPPPVQVAPPPAQPKTQPKAAPPMCARCLARNSVSKDW